MVVNAEGASLARMDEAECDVEICVGSQRFPAQSQVLIDASPGYFAIALDEKWQKKNSGLLPPGKKRVTVENVDPMLLEKALCFVHSGQMPPLDLAQQCEMALMADMLDLHELFEQTLDSIRDAIQPSNAVDILRDTTSFPDLFAPIISHACETICSNMDRYEVEELRGHINWREFVRILECGWNSMDEDRLWDFVQSFIDQESRRDGGGGESERLDKLRQVLQPGRIRMSSLSKDTFEHEILPLGILEQDVIQQVDFYRGDSSVFLPAQQEIARCFIRNYPQWSHMSTSSVDDDISILRGDLVSFSSLKDHFPFGIESPPMMVNGLEWSLTVQVMITRMGTSPDPPEGYIFVTVHASDPGEMNCRAITKLTLINQYAAELSTSVAIQSRFNDVESGVSFEKFQRLSDLLDGYSLGLCVNDTLKFEATIQLRELE